MILSTLAYARPWQIGVGFLIVGGAAAVGALVAIRDGRIEHAQDGFGED